MLRIVLVRPGATLFDEAGRIKGSLDFPLSPEGTSQADKTATELANIPLDIVYSSPCESARQTASILAKRCHSKAKTVDCLRNIDHGLWEGKLIDEVKRQQPKVYRQYQESPECVCPPGGETLESAKIRVEKTLNTWLKKHDTGTIAFVIPEPLASLVKHLLVSSDLGDLWKVECDNGSWEILQVEPSKVALT
jgi:phosphoserine phosphatase